MILKEKGGYLYIFVQESKKENRFWTFFLSIFEKWG